MQKIIPAITVETTIKAPVETVWKLWTEPKHITRWCNASDDWHAPYAENDLRMNGKFKTTMAAKDGSMSFDFEGVYTKIQEHKLIEYTINDDRKVKIAFSSHGNETKWQKLLKRKTLIRLKRKEADGKPFLTTSKNTQKQINEN